MPLGDVHFADDHTPDFGLEWRAVLPRSTLETWDEARLLAYYNLRKECDRNAELNPVGSGWILPQWGDVMKAWKQYQTIVLLGGNRSTKSTLFSRLTVWAAATIPQSECRCWHVNEDRSIEDQQRMIWEALPQQIKNLPTKKGIHHSLQYSQKNGFTDHICILPPLQGYRRGGTIKFNNYRQYQQDAQIAEGYKAHWQWDDEECPQKLFETQQYRSVDYHGRIGLSFTTLTGWTPLVQDILGKTRTLKKQFAPLVGRELPVIQESISRPGTVIFYLWTENNAFIDTTDFSKKIKGRPKEEILARAYGIPTKSIQGVFPGFNKEVNVVPHETIPFIRDQNYPVTRYQSVDPAGRKNWFIVWVGIDVAGTWWAYREWPDFDDWALPGSTAEGKAGPAQKGQSWGVKEYVEMILHAENGESIFERFIDPRASAAETQAEEGARTILTDTDKVTASLGRYDFKFIPAPGVDIEHGLQLINGLLAYDQSKPIDSQNTPRLFISDRCQNLIAAMQEYTAQGGRTENWKDPIDCMRQLAESNAEYIDPAFSKDDRKTGVY